MSDKSDNPGSGPVDTEKRANRVNTRSRVTSLHIRTLDESGNRIRLSLRHKMVLMFGVSMFLVAGLTFLAVRGRLRAEMRDGAVEELTATRRVFESLLDTHFAHLESAGGLIADAPKLRAALETLDAGTVHEEAAWFLSTMKQDLLAVVGTDKRMLSFSTSGAGKPAVPPAERLPGVLRALARHVERGLLDLDGRLYMTIATPVETVDQVTGAVVIGELLKEGFARRVHAIAGVQVAFLSGGQLRASSLDARSYAEVTARVPSGGAPMGLFALAGQNHLYLKGSYRTAPEMGGMQYILLLSMASREAACAKVEFTLWIGAGGFMLTLLILSGHISARLTRGISQLVEVANQMSRGNFDAPITVPPGDEIGYLAHTMQELRGSVADQMRKLNRVNESLRGKIEEILFNETLGAHYDQVEILGRGGMGIVYRAHDTDADRMVAIKVLSPMLAELPSVVTRFMREGQILARLEHPALIRTYHVDQSKLPYCEMEYFEGKSLQHVVCDSGPLGWSRARPMIDALLAGLAYCHGAGVIHRDIKPSNILVGPDDSVRLIDFGLARDESLTSLTHSMEAFGTPDYIAPEQECGLDTDERADVFSVGQTIYYALSGQLAKIRQTGYPPLAERRPAELADPPPPALDEILRRALDPDRDGRWPSVEAMRNALAAL